MGGSLDGSVVIVTGGARGIGREYALGVAREGGKVVVADLLDGEPVVAEIEALGGEALAVTTDVSDEASNDAMAAATIDRFGRIDVLINNAAMFSETTRGPFHELTIAEWDRTFEVNVRGVWLACKAVYPQMSAQGSGKIINIASNTLYKGTTGFLHYVASKSALIGLSRSLATELGPEGITVNTVSPDLIPNPDLRPTDETSDKFVVAGRALKRTMVAEDMVGTIVFLCTRGSDFITGQALVVNGGAYYQ
ncbi:MAG: SDR family oxidoreductase [Acidimicrobiia bacterium]|nr:SDR family oxidoreductase [Acidimicrobiia bacterium]